jgi:alpha-galactosidase
MDFPVCHLELIADEAEGHFLYKAEGEPYMRLRFEGGGNIGYRPFSDGDIMPDPFLEQMVFTAETGAGVTIEFTPRDAAVMRGRRAGDGEAILSQQGKPLIYGVNGIYDYDSDTLITWSGFDWRYAGNAVIRENGRDYIRVEGKIADRGAVFINLFFRYYRRHLGFEHHNPRKRRPNPAPVCGWATWEACRTEVSLEYLEKAAASLAETLKPWGLEYIQLDDGYQSPVMPAPGIRSIKAGWLSTNEKFPGGHEGIVEAIRKNGFLPALWTNAAVSNETYALESGKCIQGRDGKPLKAPWLGYIFDCLPKSLKEIEALYRELAAKGYRYFKVDALRHLIYDGLMAAAREGLLSNEEVLVRFRAYMEAVRRGIGEENYLLSCWGVLTANIGIADAMRVATDAASSTESLLMQTNESARWHFTHGVLYRNDSDYVCLRMEAPQARALASLVSLNGYLYMISDDTGLYTGEKLEIARKTMPPAETVGAETGPLNADSAMNFYRNMIARHEDTPSLAPGSLWAAHFFHAGRTWAVIHLLRLSPVVKDQKLSIPLQNLGLDPALDYAAFDFWEQTPLGIVKKNFTVDSPEAFQSRVIALTPLCHSLELAGGSRHISMDAVSVKGMKRADNALTLSLAGIPGETFDYWFVLKDGPLSPDDGKPVSATGEGVVIEPPRPDGFFKCSVTFGAEKEKEITLSIGGGI